MRGVFVVLDGNDGSGKATQARLLAERFSGEGTPATMIDFPGYGRNFFGDLVGECLAGKHGDFVHLSPKIASAIYALDRLESAATIRAALSEGQIVVADRFASSNQIHQGGKLEDPEERVQFIEWLDHMEHEVLGIPRPDAVVYLRVPLAVSLALLQEKRKPKNMDLKAGERDTVEGDRQYLERSHEAANWLVARQPNWKLVECALGATMRPVDDIHEEIYALVRSLIPIPLPELV